jgi:hypothetical protein
MRNGIGVLLKSTRDQNSRYGTVKNGASPKWELAQNARGNENSYIKDYKAFVEKWGFCIYVARGLQLLESPHNPIPSGGNHER